MTQKHCLSDDAKVIGLCADIHGAFLNVESMVKARPQVKHWFCAGDMVRMDGPLHDNQPTLRLLRRYGISAVLGNHDVYVSEREASKLDAENLEYLQSLPVHLDIDFAGMKVAMYHATPESLEEVVREDSDAALFRTFFNQDRADVIVLGHTHWRFQRKIDDTLFVNPGYLGGAGSHPSFALLHSDGNVEFVEL